MWFIPWHRYTCVCFISPMCLSPRKINPTIVTKQIQNNIFHTIVLTPPPQYKVFLCVFIVSKVWERKTLTGQLHSNLLTHPSIWMCSFYASVTSSTMMMTNHRWRRWWWWWWLYIVFPESVFYCLNIPIFHSIWMLLFQRDACNSNFSQLRPC